MGGGGGRGCSLESALDRGVAEDVSIVETVQLFEDDEGEHGVRTDTEEVGGEALPEGQHAFRLDRPAKHILDTKNKPSVNCESGGDGGY